MLSFLTCNFVQLTTEKNRNTKRPQQNNQTKHSLHAVSPQVRENGYYATRNVELQLACASSDKIEGRSVRFHNGGRFMYLSLTVVDNFLGEDEGRGPL